MRSFYDLASVLQDLVTDPYGRSLHDPVRVGKHLFARESLADMHKEERNLYGGTYTYCKNPYTGKFEDLDDLTEGYRSKCQIVLQGLVNKIVALKDCTGLDLGQQNEKIKELIGLVNHMYGTGFSGDVLNLISREESDITANIRFVLREYVTQFKAVREGVEHKPTTRGLPSSDKSVSDLVKETGKKEFENDIDKQIAANPRLKDLWKIATQSGSKDERKKALVEAIDEGWYEKELCIAAMPFFDGGIPGRMLQGRMHKAVGEMSSKNLVRQLWFAFESTRNTAMTAIDEKIKIKPIVCLALQDVVVDPNRGGNQSRLGQCAALRQRRQKVSSGSMASAILSVVAPKKVDNTEELPEAVYTAIPVTDQTLVNPASYKQIERLVGKKGDDDTSRFVTVSYEGAWIDHPKVKGLKILSDSPSFSVSGDGCQCCFTVSGLGKKQRVSASAYVIHKGRLVKAEGKAKELVVLHFESKLSVSSAKAPGREEIQKAVENSLKTSRKVGQVLLAEEGDSEYRKSAKGASRQGVASSALDQKAAGVSQALAIYKLLKGVHGQWGKWRGSTSHWYKDTSPGDSGLAFKVHSLADAAGLQMATVANKEVQFSFLVSSEGHVLDLEIVPIADHLPSQEEISNYHHYNSGGSKGGSQMVKGEVSDHLGQIASLQEQVSSLQENNIVQINASALNGTCRDTSKGSSQEAAYASVYKKNEKSFFNPETNAVIQEHHAQVKEKRCQDKESKFSQVREHLLIQSKRAEPPTKVNDGGESSSEKNTAFDPEKEGKDRFTGATAKVGHRAQAGGGGVSRTLKGQSKSKTDSRKRLLKELIELRLVGGIIRALKSQSKTKADSQKRWLSWALKGLQSLHPRNRLFTV